MVSVTIRDIDDQLQARLRVRADARGHSVEEEAHDILRSALSMTETQATSNLGQAIRKRLAPLGGVILDIPPREPMRDPPDFAA